MNQAALDVALQKKRKSNAQLMQIGVDPSYKELYDEISEKLFEVERMKDRCVQDSHNWLLDKGLIASLQAQITLLNNTIKVFVGSGTSTIIRSFYEVYMTTFESGLWRLVIFLYNHLNPAEPYNDSMYHGLLERIGTSHDLMTWKLQEVNDVYDRCYEVTLFLKSIHNMYGRERKEKIREYYADVVEPITELSDCPRVEVDAVRQALKSVYVKLCNDVHQAGARFGDEDGTFMLPRASDILSLDVVYAYATIVRDVGLTPKYPTFNEERQLYVNVNHS